MLKEFLKLHRTLKLRLLMNFLGALCYSTVGASMTIYYNKYMGAGITGILLIISSVLVFFAGLYAGHLSDQFGRRPIMLFSTLITALGAALAAFSNSAWYFDAWLTFFGFLVLNFGFGFFNTASQAMIVDLTGPDNRKFVYGVQYWIFNFAILIGSALSGWFFRDFLFWLILAIALEELLSFLIVLFFIPESFDPKKQHTEPERNILKSYWSVMTDTVFMYYCFGSVFIAMIFNQFDYYLPVHLSNDFITSRFFGIEIYGQRMLTVFLVLSTLLIVLFMNFITRLTDTWSARISIGVGISLMGSGMIMAFLGRNMSWELAAVVVSAVGEMILVPSSQSLRASLMDSKQIGTYTGAFGVTQTIAAVFSGVILSFSAVYGDKGMSFLMIVIIVLGISPVLHAISLDKKRRKISS